ncbi:ABC transporter ATP-binding protein [Enterococcus italicus]|uniref:ABC transporter ATP-binding protein n=1 Tax=Enterococcus italicus TaxID=246144 RepID=UPI003F4664C8
MSLLTIEELTVKLNTAKNEEKVLVHPLSLSVNKGEVVGIVGESGSGKSITMKSLLNLLPDGAQASYDTFLFQGQSVTPKDKLPISMIFQDPMTSLNPVRTIGYHLIEVIRRQQRIPKRQAKELAIQELTKVGIPLPERRMKQYPHELSGGMRQRVMIAMALLAKPKLLVADEPTTALDVTIQAQILTLIQQLQKEEQLAVLLVTHDFGVVAGMCDAIKVMYQGQLVEEGTTEEIFYHAAHPYTQQLLAAAHLGDKELVEEPKKHQIQSEGEWTVLSPTHRVWLGGSTHE